MKRSSDLLRGQVALVTGASSGIGEARDIGAVAVWLASDKGF